MAPFALSELAKLMTHHSTPTNPPIHQPTNPPTHQQRTLHPSAVSYLATLPVAGMTTNKTDLLQGTLDMLLMRAVSDESLHGYALVHRLNIISGGRLSVPQGSLYPALHRLENQGILKATWGQTDTGREAKFYRLTAKGRKRLDAEMAEWRELSLAISMVLGGAQ
jgi:PadR family transcriptional regulator PadR